MMETNRYIEERVYPQRKKSRKYTLIFSLIFAAFGGMIFLGMIAGIAVNVDSMDGSWLLTLNKKIASLDNLFLFWRLFLYMVLLGIYYQITKSRFRKAKNRYPKRVAFHMCIRVGAYLILFELFVVQNLLGNAINLISN